MEDRRGQASRRGAPGSERSHDRLCLKDLAGRGQSGPRRETNAHSRSSRANIRCDRQRHQRGPRTGDRGDPTNESGLTPLPQGCPCCPPHRSSPRRRFTPNPLAQSPGGRGPQSRTAASQAPRVALPTRLARHPLGERPGFPLDSYQPGAGRKIAKTAPCGSASTAKRPMSGMLLGGTIVFPPAFAAFAAVASTSSDAK